MMVLALQEEWHHVMAIPPLYLIRHDMLAVEPGVARMLAFVTLY
jgi:hypothetical protein